MLPDPNSVDSSFEMRASGTKINVPEVESLDSRARQNHQLARILIRRGRMREGFCDYLARTRGIFDIRCEYPGGGLGGRFPVPLYLGRGCGGSPRPA